jgi:pSer/pThr/pTyr-binding forkhead associated (FHA) protein
MRGMEESRAAAFRSGFFSSYLAHEIQGRLRADAVRFPEQLRVEVEVATGLPLPGEVWLTVVATSQERAGTAGDRARIVVQQGAANVTELTVDKPRVYIGREVDVYRDGGIRRRNDLAFAEESVSREHAHIDYDEHTGECRLFNDRWYTRGSDCGTRIVRDGVSLEVHRDTRGTKLEPGDEIHLGRAIVSLVMQR